MLKTDKTFLFDRLTDDADRHIKDRRELKDKIFKHRFLLRIGNKSLSLCRVLTVIKA